MGSHSTRKFRIRLNWPLILRDMSKEEGRPVPQQEVIDLLKQSGFSQDGDYWVAEESSLGLLDPAEVLEAEPLPDKPKKS